jgi:energy-coupling factor transporter ATP-binding protein EcfA2
MDVLKEILTWSSTRPDWQRDALRRFVTTGPLTKNDIDELTQYCKASHGLAERTQTMPLEARHLPNRGTGLEAVTVNSLTHHRGVNALALDQRLEIGSALTIVYGPNGAGKSGYTRILKRACRARGAEEILGNVVGDPAIVQPSATIEYTVGNTKKQFAWSDKDEAQEDLGRVSVLDSYCATVYLNEKTDVAFRPFGLDLFDKLSDACEEIKDLLEKERKELANQGSKLPSVAEGTTVHKLLSSITSLTNPVEVEKLGTLSDDEKASLSDIGKRLHDLTSDDPRRTARVLNLRAQRIGALKARLEEVDKAIGSEGLRELSRTRGAMEEAANKISALHNDTFHAGLLTGTGSDIWRGLWEAAREFSTKSAYPQRRFPVTDRDSKCVLCQQEFSEEAAKQLQMFEQFLLSEAQKDLESAQTSHRTLRHDVENLVVSDESTEQALLELQVENEPLAKQIQGVLRAAQAHKEEIVRALADNGPIPRLTLESESTALEAAAEKLRGRAGQLLESDQQAVRSKLSQQLKELKAREILGNDLQLVFDEIERKKKLAAYQLCLQDTHTGMITRKSTEVTKLAVTEQLSVSFKEELLKLRFVHHDVELQPTGGERGSLFHKLVLKRAVGAEIPRIVSEGEARTLSIAAFFSELATASDRSAILFDDPVSSLDHEWRENVARRLAEESKVRQVVVFTHDIVFLLALKKLAEDMAVHCDHQYLHREYAGAGVASPRLPWVAMKVKDRIGVLKEMWVAADKLFRTATRSEYEREAVFIYGRLREAWERGFEEVLLGGVVERYRPSIQTLHAKLLADITEDDCDRLEAGMTKCSRWLPGHDQSAAENVSIPEPKELSEDIAALEAWMKTITKRRKS